MYSFFAYKGKKQVHLQGCLVQWEEGFVQWGWGEGGIFGINRDSTPEMESPSTQSFNKIISISDCYKWRHLHFCSPRKTMCLHERRTRQDTLAQNGLKDQSSL